MLHITPDMMEAAYELLRRTKPFSGWRLPEPDVVSFQVLKTIDRQADWRREGDTHVIRVSASRGSTLQWLLECMAHEMCHMRQDIARPRDQSDHGSYFRRLGAQVCRHHHFDPKAF